MQPADPVKRMTVEEYLRMERASPEKHNYVDGIVFPVYGPLPGELVGMAGESGPHADITVSLSALIHAQLRGKPCRVRTKDTKVRGGPLGPRNPRAASGLYYYPDAVIICGPVEYHDEHRDVVTNPKVIIEVLSPSTEAFDRPEKFERYERWNPSLSDYLLIRQNRPHVEHFARQPDGSWIYTRTAELDAVVEIPSVGVVLRLAEVYERVEFPDPADTLFPDLPPETPNS